MRSTTPAVRGALFFLLLALAVLVGRHSRTDGLDLSLVWPAAGVAALWLLACRTWLARVLSPVAASVAIGGVVLLTGSDLPTALVTVGSTLAGAGAAAWTVRLTWGVRRITLRRVPDLVRLCVLAAADAAVSTGTAGVLSRLLRGVVMEPTFLAVVAVRTALGTLLVVALALAWQQRRADHVTRGEVVGWVSDGALAVAWTALVVVGAGPTFTYALVPLTVAVAMRHGVLRTVVHLCVAAVSAVVLTLEGPGSAVDGVLDRILVNQGFLAVLVVVGLGLTLLREEQRAALRLAQTTSARMRRMVDGALIAQLVLRERADGALLIARANPAASALLGVGADRLVGTPWVEHVDRAHRAEIGDAIAAVTRGDVPSWSGEVQHVLTDGASRWAQVSVAPMEGGDEDTEERTLSVQLLDVTARKDVEAQLAHLALHDVLTGLANRTLLSDRVHQALAAGRREDGRVALVFLDLDHFKAVNDRHGHGTGDAMLVAVADRLRSVARAGDTVARLGGDEFVVCCPGVRSEDEAWGIAERFLAAVGRPVVVADTPLEVRASAGVTVSDHGSTVQSLLLESDAAMYEAKRRGRGRLEPFVDDLAAGAARAAELEEQLRLAVDRREMRVVFQPILQVEDERVTGYEALVRWAHPTRGVLPPGEWMDVAEQSGLIVPIGGFVLRDACRQIAALADPDATVHVNVSARQLQGDGLVDAVAAATADAGLDTHRLVLELTETHLVEVHHSLLSDLERLRATGVRIAADDFGTGFSALQQLVELPIDVLKIDRTFVWAMLEDPRASAVVHAVVALADELDLEVVAEGVETQAQAAALRAAGCHQAQGYLWGRPAALSTVVAPAEPEPAARR